MKKTLVVASLLFLSSHSAYSATLIESEEPNAGIQKTWIEGAKLRVAPEGEDQYMLMNFNDRTMHIVHPGKMQVIDMTNIVATHNKDEAKTDSSVYTVQHTGQGPIIAGYQTEHYTVSLDGKKCFESFTSTKAVQEMGLNHFIAGMNDMFPRENSMDEGTNPCLNAENALDYGKIGLPLRLVEENGEVIYSITLLKKGVDVPEDGFALPEKFMVIDYGQMVEQMMHSQGQ